MLTGNQLLSKCFLSCDAWLKIGIDIQYVLESYPDDMNSLVSFRKMLLVLRGKEISLLYCSRV